MEVPRKKPGHTFNGKDGVDGCLDGRTRGIRVAWIWQGAGRADTAWGWAQNGAAARSCGGMCSRVGAGWALGVNSMGRAAVSGWMALGRFDGDGIGGGAGLDGARRRLDGDGMNIRVGLMALDLDLMLGGGVGLDGPSTPT